jgi:2-methylisocitrate lyase-like PEP mutase family enzyme
MIVYSQSEKAERFKQLYESLLILVIPNLWNIGSPKILSQQGYPAFSTTNAVLAYLRHLYHGRV